MWVGLRKLHTNLRKIAPAGIQIHNFANYFFPGGDVFQIKRLAFTHRFLQLQKRSVGAHDQRLGVLYKGSAIQALSGNTQRDRQENPLAAPLVGRERRPKIRRAHDRASPSLWLSACMKGTTGYLEKIILVYRIVKPVNGAGSEPSYSTELLVQRGRLKTLQTLPVWNHPSYFPAPSYTMES